MQRKMQININNNQAIVEQFFLPFSPRSLGDSYLAVSYGYFTGPQTGILLENSIQADLSGEEIKVVWRPAASEERKYMAKMDCYGMVGANSNQKQKAYDVLRKMMDTPISIWTVSTYGNYENTMCPVHVENAKALINIVETEGTKQFLQHDLNSGEIIYDVAKVGLSEEMKNSIDEVLSRTILYQKDWELAARINERANVYIENNVESCEDCYQEILQVIHD